jgi:hypothetical protein
MRTRRTVIPKRSATRRPPTLALCLAALASTLSGACGGPASPSATNQSLSIGEWSGTTSQGMPIAFSVSQDEKVTTLTLGYRFNSCSGTQTFSNLSLPTAPDVTCVPGPCPMTVSSYRAFSFADGSRLNGQPNTSVNGLFLPGNRAEGQAGFNDYAGCGTAAGVTWTALRR